MILNVKATNTKTGEVISYALEGNADEGFTYEGTHMQEVADNKIREVNDTLILLGSPIYTIKSGETATVDHITFDIEVTAE
jgi:3D (Asp-Asp-Asp) domain-containing protein